MLARQERKLQAGLPSGVTVHNNGIKLTVLVPTHTMATAVTPLIQQFAPGAMILIA